MPFPLAPEKYSAQSATQPSKLFKPDKSVPDAVILCFQPPVYEYAQETYDGHLVSRDQPRYSLYVLDDPTANIGVVGELGIGGPATARVLEELIARGVETVVIVGHAGGLQRDIEPSDVVVVDEALRDEGTSHHYLEPGRTIEASPSLQAALVETVEVNGETVHVGTTWTMDAIFRLTPTEIERYAAAGVLTTDMEAASAFAVATHRGIDAGAAFVISDYVGPDEWEGYLPETWPHLERLFDCTVETLSSA